MGSTSLLESMDPEDWRVLLNQAFERLAPAVRRYDGRIAQYLGDGLLALFGAPTAHEDDPVRATLAALDVLAEAAAYADEVRARAGISFSVRLGLDAGEVVAGALGEGASAEYLAVGEAVNTAARLQALADPMTALASEAVVRGLDGRFVVEDRGPLALKGRSKPLRAFRVVSRVAETGSMTSRPRPAAGLVGRSEELRLLSSAIETARAGRSAAVAILGDPGIGKSRLLEELRSVALERGVRWAEAHGQSYGGETTHHLLAALLRDLSGATDDRGPERFLRFATAIGTDPTVGPTLAEIAWPGSQPKGPSDPRGLLLARRRALRALVDAVVTEGPLVLALEDLHRADPASVAILDALAGERDVPCLLVATSRQEPETAGWGLVAAIRAQPAGRGIVVELEPLSDADSGRLVADLLPGAPVPAEVLAVVSGRAEGNPLFVEQIVRSLLDEGTLRQVEERWQASAVLGATSIPTTIQGLLLARIDRLDPEARAAIHVGAVVGRRFSGSLIAKVGAAVHLPLPANLASIGASGLVTAPTDESNEFVFRHALIQEAAYASLLRADRALLHRAVARAIAALQPGRVDAVAPALAFHHRRAGDLGSAIRSSLVAGRCALAAHANTEALAAFDDVLAMLEELPGRARRARRGAERQAHEGRGDVLGWLHQRDEALVAYEAAEAALPPGRSLERARLVRKRAGLLTSGQRVAEALAAFGEAERMLGAPSAVDDAARAEWVELHLARAGLHYFRGDLAGLEDDLAVVGPWIEEQGSPEQQLGFLSQRISAAFRRSRYVVDRETVALERRALELARRIGDPAAEGVREFSLGLALLLADELGEAETRLERALAIAGACQDELLVGRILAYRPMLARKQGDVEGCRSAAAAALEAARTMRLPDYVAVATASQAWIAWREGDAAGARAAASAATRLWDDGAFRYPCRWVAVLPVIALDLEADDLDAAVAGVREVLDPVQQRLPARLESALESVVGAWARGDVGAARSALVRSVGAARSLGYL